MLKQTNKYTKVKPCIRARMVRPKNMAGGRMILTYTHSKKELDARCIQLQRLYDYYSRLKYNILIDHINTCKDSISKHVNLYYFKVTELFDKLYIMEAVLKHKYHNAWIAYKEEREYP